MTTTTINYSTPVDDKTRKREIIERLIKAEQLSLEEGLLLMQPEIAYVPQVFGPMYTPTPWTPPTYPYFEINCTAGVPNAFTLTN